MTLPRWPAWCDWGTKRRADRARTTDRYGQSMESFVLPTLNSGIDQLGIVGTVAPGIFAQPGRCWRFVYEKPSGQAGHCMAPVSWRGRHRYATGWKPVWSCEGHAGELVGARKDGGVGGTPVRRRVGCLPQ